MLDKTWQKMYQKAKAVQGFREISSHMEAGGVAAAVLSDSGRNYTGVCVDTASTLEYALNAMHFLIWLLMVSQISHAYWQLCQMVKLVHHAEPAVNLWRN